MASGGQMIQQSHSMPSGVDSTGLATSTPEHKKLAQNLVSVKVKMLDDSFSVFHIQHKLLGKVLFEQVCQELHLLESDYFGIEYMDQNKTKYWLDHEKQMNRQIGLSLVDPVLVFCVKFYTPDPAQLEEPYTRYLFALQIKRNLADGILLCNDNTSALMSSFIIQAECGDFMEEDYPDHTYLSSTKFVPHQDVDMQLRIMEHYKKHRGQTPEVADLNLLEIARRYSGKTQKEVIDYVRSNFIKRQPFQRSASFKMTRNVHRIAHPAMGRSISTHLPMSESEQNFAQHHNAASTPVSQSCGSVTLTDKSGDDLSPSRDLPPDTPTFNQRQSSSLKKIDKIIPGAINVLSHFDKPLEWSNRCEDSYENLDNTYHIPPPEGFSPELPLRYHHSGDPKKPSEQLVTVEPINKSPKPPVRKDSKPSYSSEKSPPSYRNLKTLNLDENTPSQPIQSSSHSMYSCDDSINVPHTRREESDMLSPIKTKSLPLPPKRHDSKLNSGVSAPQCQVNIESKSSKNLSELENRAKSKSCAPQTVSVSVNTDPLDFGSSDVQFILPKDPSERQFDISPKETIQNILRSALPPNQSIDECKVPDKGKRERVPNVSSSKLPDNQSELLSTSTKHHNAGDLINQVIKSEPNHQVAHSYIDPCIQYAPAQSPLKEPRPKSSPKITTITIVKRKVEKSKNVDGTCASPPPSETRCSTKNIEKTIEVVRSVEQPHTTTSSIEEVSSISSKEKLDQIMDAVMSGMSPTPKVKSEGSISNSVYIGEEANEPKSTKIKTTNDRDLETLNQSKKIKSRSNEDSITSADIDGELKYVLKKRFVALHSVDQSVDEFDEPDKTALAKGDVHQNSSSKHEIEHEPKVTAPEQKIASQAKLTKFTPSGKIRSKVPPPKPPRDVHRSCSDTHHVTIEFTDSEKKSCIFKSQKMPSDDQTDFALGVVREPVVNESSKTKIGEKSSPSLKIENTINENTPVKEGDNAKDMQSNVFKSEVSPSSRESKKENSIFDGKSLSSSKQSAKPMKPEIEELKETSSIAASQNAVKDSKSISQTETFNKPRKSIDLSLKLTENDNSKLLQSFKKNESAVCKERKSLENVELVYISGSKDSDPSCEVILLPPNVNQTKLKPVPPPKPKKKPAVPPKPAVGPKPAHLTKQAILKGKEKQEEKRNSVNEVSEPTNATYSEDENSVTEKTSSKVRPKSPKTVKSPVLYSHWKPLVTSEIDPAQEILWTTPKSPKSTRCMDVVSLSLLPSSDSYSFKDDTVSSKSPDSELLEKLTIAHGEIPPVPPFPKHKEMDLRKPGPSKKEEHKPCPLPPLHADFNTNIYIGHTFRALSRISEGSHSEQSQSDSSPPREMCDISSDSSEKSSTHSDQRRSGYSNDTLGGVEMNYEHIFEHDINVLDDVSDSSNMDQFYLEINSDEREELEKQGHMFSCNQFEDADSTASSIGDDTLCEEDLNKSYEEASYEYDNAASQEASCFGQPDVHHNKCSQDSSFSNEDRSHSSARHVSSIYVQLNTAGGIDETEKNFDVSQD
ncbi:FERM, ARHGEF and pleckstrin domain-containing protein 1 [Nymphon striatum]|nr:FERM, ARHGEF and pleckstrin domain-containing protein 1 [Nymphon striatum]